MGRWINKIQNDATCEPSKPSKAPFEPFEGRSPSPFQKNSNRQAELSSESNEYSTHTEISTNPPFEAFEGLPPEHIQKMKGTVPNLFEAISNVTADLQIKVDDTLDKLSNEDIEDWKSGRIDTASVRAFALSLIERREMNRGIVPPDYIKKASCKHCGPIWLWFSGAVQGCPWCWNRISGDPIPRPCFVQCGNCLHYDRIDHPNLGHCKKGQIEPIAGLWETDKRSCLSYLPKVDLYTQ